MNFSINMELLCLRFNVLFIMDALVNFTSGEIFFFFFLPNVRHIFVRVKLIRGKVNDFEKILAFRFKRSPFSWKHFKLCILLLNTLH